MTKQQERCLTAYSTALDMLDDYDHQRTAEVIEGRDSSYVLTYEECIEVIKSMKFGEDSDMFANEKDSSFAASLGNLYQTFGEVAVYPTLQEKAANLLYFVVKNHAFSDGNKRIAAALFLYFLDKNNALFDGERKLIDDYTLVCLTLLIAHSRPEEKALMIDIVVKCLNRK